MLIPIGQFSRMVRLSIKALRLYADRGLLLPAYVDAGTGYRYYQRGQARRAEVIRMLRAVDMSLDDIRAVLDAGTNGDVRDQLEAHRRRLEERLATQQRLLVFLESLMANEERIMPYEITVSPVKPQVVGGIRLRTSLKSIKSDVSSGFMKLMQGIGRFRCVPAGPPMLVYHDVIDELTEGDVEVCVPVQTPFDGDDQFRCHDLPGGEVAATVHHGPYEELSSAYRTLAEWMMRNGYEVEGATREIYLNDPRVVPPDQLQTRLEFAVTKRSDGEVTLAT